ncbi:MAG: C4-dicarboxylate ABC transporter substrate-binding protein [Burkholderiales bacterium 28-67-8]|nr:MAG: C4-dicarboxylate ABC transporter substrate-binding protein [Burkholderiales bacterium 28-67-8]
MNTSPRNSAQSLRDLTLTIGPFVVLAVALLLAAYYVLDPTPPKKVVLATGVEQGAYAAFGKRYAALLKEHGIEVELRSTQGTAENLALLRDAHSGVDLAFVQGGFDDLPVAAEDEDAPPSLVSLGSLFYEPIWLFYREDSARRLLHADTLSSLPQLAGWRLNIGAPGSGIQHLMEGMLEANHLAEPQLTLLKAPATSAVATLLAGESDALALASAPESQAVQTLLNTPGIRLFDFAQAEAYSRRFVFMRPLVLPRGVVDLAGDVPAHDVHLVAPAATLVAREGTHPALIQLFVQAAQKIHGGAGWFQRKGDFPSPLNTERPLAKEAQRFYQNGIPVLQRHLPFGVANLIDRMWPVVVSILAMLLPFTRVLPPVYQLRIRRRVFRWYEQLREIEARNGTESRQALLDQLDELESRVSRVSVPLSYTDELYALRSHIALVRTRLNDTAGAALTPPPARSPA